MIVFMAHFTLQLFLHPAYPTYLPLTLYSLGLFCYYKFLTKPVSADHMWSFWDINGPLTESRTLKKN